jgi:cytochrome c553
MTKRCATLAMSFAAIVFPALQLGCPTGTPAEGEGEGEREPIDVGPPPNGFDVTPPAGAAGEACSTGQWWVEGDEESSMMHPGGDCIDCHTREGEGPRFVEDDCRGIPEVQVELLDLDGAVFLTLQSNAAGNFFSSAALTGNTPYTARITYEGRTSEMSTPQTDGACMSCHTAEGSSGRIVVP